MPFPAIEVDEGVEQPLLSKRVNIYPKLPRAIA